MYSIALLLKGPPNMLEYLTAISVAWVSKASIFLLSFFFGCGPSFFLNPPLLCWFIMQVFSLSPSLPSLLPFL